MTPRKESLDREFYFGEEADLYAKSKWMARNQMKSTKRALELLEDARIGGKLRKPSESNVILDLGCGSGFSTYIIEENGFKTIGLDNSFDMLIQNKEKTTPYTRNLVCGLIEALPFRRHIFNHMISISAFNFILENVNETQKRKKLQEVSEKLSKLLVVDGRCVIEFYPKKEDIHIYLESLKNFIGGMVIDNPNQRKEQKFLILRVKP
jgi:ubiquinone/menaquinone biosynthesis C-methylase UbiE